jgi:hypothetical protein
MTFFVNQLKEEKVVECPQPTISEPTDDFNAIQKGKRLR